ncbi:MAG: protein kinase, partial [Anaerolineae bacterium]
MIGSKLGPYQIREEVGRGGMATVYRAYQPTVDRDVAIKVITAAITARADAVQRFQREARLIARLEHPHILPVYDFDGGHAPPYIVMRYLDGGTLKAILKQGLLPPAEIAFLLGQIGAALDYAHRQGIIHRDVKPSNIMIDREGNAFVTDFGLARMVDVGGAGKQITKTGMVMGTPDYMSPEQALGESEIDHRADIYALGVIFYQMLTGELPFRAETAMAVLVQHMQAPVPAATAHNPDLPPVVDGVIATALAKSPAERHTSIVDFVAAATAALGQSPGGSPGQLRQAAADSIVLRRLAPDAAPKRDTQTPSEQNKTVTALSAGAADLSEIIEEERGPEAARAAVASLWQAAAKIVEERGGAVVSRGDDALLAVWGAETAREDDPEQAVRAALDIQAAVPSEAIPLQIGIHTGLALISPAGDSGSYSATGTTISLTHRLMQTAYESILITHNVYSQVRGIFDVQADAPLKLRRGRGTIPTYRVLAAKPRAFRLATRGVEGVETQMVGRAAELTALQNAFLDAVEESETQLITLTGEAGIGKSRLLYEFNNWAELRPERFFWLNGRATPEMSPPPETGTRIVS